MTIKKEVKVENKNGSRSLDELLAARRQEQAALMPKKEFVTLQDAQKSEALKQNIYDTKNMSNTGNHHVYKTDKSRIEKANNRQAIKTAQAKKNVVLVSNKKKSAGIGHMPELKEEEALLCDKMHFDAKEAYKLLRTNVIFSLPDSDKCRTVGITSAVRGEGKSTVAVNLAYTLAETNSQVLLIDMDMRLPSIAKKLKMDKTKGLSDYLIGRAGIEEITHISTKYKNWHIIESGSIPPAPSELIGSDNMKNLIHQLEENYDFIIIDLPPVNIVSDALVAKDIVDGFILTIRQDYSDKHSVADCLRQLNFLNTNILGFLLTDCATGSHYGGKYKYRNKYYKKYKKNYGYYKKYGYGYGYGKSGGGQ